MRLTTLQDPGFKRLGLKIVISIELITKIQSVHCNIKYIIFLVRESLSEIKGGDVLRSVLTRPIKHLKSLKIIRSRVIRNVRRIVDRSLT